MRKTAIVLLCLATFATACKDGAKKNENVLLQPFATPFQTPPFEQIKMSDYKPAFVEGIRQQEAEIEAIVNNPEEPTFENTVAALDRSGELLNRVASIFFNLQSANTSDEMQQLAMEISPLVTAHSDAINMNPKLFARIKALYDKKESLGLDSLEARTLELYYKDFVRGGANLNDTDKAALAAINKELATLGLQFGNNLLAETNAFILTIDKEEDLAGIPESLRAAAAAEAEKRGMKGKWVFTVQSPSIFPFLQYAQNRELREKLLMGYYMRGNNNNANDNKKIVSRMSNLRLQKAKLQGFDTYADYVIDVNMAKTSKAVFDFLGRVWEPALKVAKQELAEMQAIADKEGLGDKLQCWDWWYYAEKLRKQKYDLDENEMKPYLSLENVREGMFHVANKLYGITLQQRTDVPVYYPGVEVYEVKEADGSSLGLLYMDYFTRASKSGGAWMTEFRSYTEKNGKVELPLVSLVYNISPAAKGEPVLLSWDNTETMFHEFGHALHGFFTRGKYHRIAGTIPRDMVELPSQVMENWASEPEVLKVYAKHYQTGETMPDELIAKIQESGHFNQGFATVEYIAASLLDMEWNSITTEGDQDVEAFEKAAMDKYGLIPEIKPRYRTTYFSHVFDGGYAAGYYVYLWAEVLDADTFNAFKASGDIYNQELATKFRKYVLSEGGYADPMSQYIKFRGETPTEDALLQKRGLK